MTREECGGVIPYSLWGENAMKRNGMKLGTPSVDWILVPQDDVMED